MSKVISPPPADPPTQPQRPDGARDKATSPLNVSAQPTTTTKTAVAPYRSVQDAAAMGNATGASKAGLPSRVDEAFDGVADEKLRQILLQTSEKISHIVGLLTAGQVSRPQAQAQIDQCLSQAAARPQLRARRDVCDALTRLCAGEKQRDAQPGVRASAMAAFSESALKNPTDFAYGAIKRIARALDAAYEVASAALNETPHSPPPPITTADFDVIDAQGRVMKNSEYQHQKIADRAARDLEGLATSPLAAIAYLGAKIFTADPDKQSAAIQLGQVVGGVGFSLSVAHGASAEMRGLLRSSEAPAPIPRVAETNEPIRTAELEHFGGPLQLGPTLPRRPASPDATPGGDPAAIRSNLSPSNKRGLERQNEAARLLAQLGFDVEQHPRVSKTNRNPDYRINGRIFDAYAPDAGTDIRNIWSEVRRKLGQDPRRSSVPQTYRVVLIMTDSRVDDRSVVEQFDKWELKGLQELIIVRKNRAYSLWVN